MKRSIKIFTAILLVNLLIFSSCSEGISFSENTKKELTTSQNIAFSEKEETVLSTESSEPASAFFVHDNELSEEEILLVRNAEKEIESSICFEDSIDKQISDAELVLSKQKNYGFIEEYQISSTSIEVRYACGITYIFLLNFSEEPTYANTPGKIDTLLITTPEINWNDDFGDPKKMYSSLANTGDIVMDGNIASYESLKNGLKGQDVVIWNGHGGWKVLSEGPFLMINEKMSSQSPSVEDFLYGRVIDTSTGYYAITSEFISYHYDENDFSGCLFFFSSCYTGHNDGVKNGNALVEAFLNYGASAVLAYDSSVLQRYANKIATSFFKRLSQKDSRGNYLYNAKEALEFAKDQHGEYDTNWIGDIFKRIIEGGHKTTMILYGDESFTLSNYVTETSASIQDISDYELYTEYIEAFHQFEISRYSSITTNLLDDTSYYHALVNGYLYETHYGGFYADILHSIFIYSLYDINGDGIEELLIALDDVSGDIFNEGLSVYTIEEGAVISLLQGDAHSAYTIYENGVICQSWAHTGSEQYLFSSINDGKLIEHDGLYYHRDTNFTIIQSGLSVFESDTIENDLIDITAEEYETIKSKYLDNTEEVSLLWKDFDELRLAYPTLQLKE